MNDKILLLVLLFSSLFFGLLMMSASNAYSYSPPSFNELNVTSGTLSFGMPNGRYGRPVRLITGSKKIDFRCKLKREFGYGCFFDKSNRDLMNGKFAKVWWREETYFGLFKENRLYQLEVDNKLLINYLDKKEEYSDSKSYGFLVYAVLFIFSLCMSVSFGWRLVRITNNK